MPLSELPPEIFDRYILPLLTPEDVVNLGRCFPLTITKKVYDSLFHTSSNFLHYNLEMFERRASAKLYVFGDVRPRIRDFEKECPESYEFVKKIRLRRMHSPLKIETAGTIIQVSLGKEELCVLQSSGDLYVSRTNRGKPYEMLKATTWIDSPDGYGCSLANISGIVYNNPNANVAWFGNVTEDDSEDEHDLVNIKGPWPTTDLPPGVSKYSQNVLSLPHSPVRFVDVVSGSGTYALDSTGLLRKWEERDPDGFPLCLLERAHKVLVTNPILQLRQSDTECACLLKGLGIARFVHIRFNMPDIPDTIQNGYRCLKGGELCRIEVDVLPGTKNVSKWAVGKQGVVILKADGTVRAVPFSEKSKGFSAVATKANQIASFSNVYASRNLVCLLKEGGTGIVVVTKQKGFEEELMQVVDAPPGVQISSLAVAPFHFLALSVDGEVYSWGRERRCSGCLGLGRFQNAIRRDGVVFNQERRSLSVDVLTKVDLPGRAWDVFASKDRSGVLLSEFSDSEKSHVSQAPLYPFLDFIYSFFV